MAIFTPGPLVGAISGNLGATNFVASARGSYIRPAIRRTNTQTQLQLEQRAWFRTVQNAWRGLSPELKDAYATAARNLRMTNRLGTPRSLSPWQLFLKQHLAEKDHAVVIAGRAPMTRFTYSPWLFTVDLPTNAPWEYYAIWRPIAVGPGGAPPAFDCLAYIFISRPFSSSPRKLYKNWFYLTTVFSTAITEEFYDPTDPNPDPRLDNLRAGEYIAVRLQWVDVAGVVQGLPSVPVTTQAMVYT